MSGRASLFGTISTTNPAKMWIFLQDDCYTYTICYYYSQTTRDAQGHHLYCTID